jgi:hypothetical protein
MAMSELPPDFKEFLKLLRSNEVRYLLVGGYAVNIHGYHRSTNDMDIWIDIDPENANRIVRVLNDFGFRSKDLVPALFLEPHQLFRMGVAPVRLEILTTIDGVAFAECYEARITEKVDEIEIDVIDLEHLRRNKAASGRLKDLDDLEHLK